MSDSLTAFRDGKRPDDIAFYVADAIVDQPERLKSVGTAVGDGTIFVLPGSKGRDVFKQTTGEAAMEFAGQAMKHSGDIAATLDAGHCPACEQDAVELVLAFVEQAHPEVGGRYADGPVLHAYARCGCGEYYSDSWSVSPS